MNAVILQNFRLAQLAFKGAYFMVYNCDVAFLSLGGIDVYKINDDIDIVEISLDSDKVSFIIDGGLSFVPIEVLSDKVIIDLTNILKAKALELADKDVMVNGKGELA